MKKSLLLIALILSGLTATYAQVEIKALVGTNFASLNGHNLTDVKANGGYHFGGGLLFGDKFYVEPGIQFGKKSSTITMSTTEFDFDQNFVRIPVYAGYHLLGHESGALALRVFGGPAVTIPGSIKKGDDQISKDDINNALWGIDAGVGLDILFLFVEVNYEYSMSDHFVDGVAAEGKHNAVYLNAGIHLDF